MDENNIELQEELRRQQNEPFSQRVARGIKEDLAEIKEQGGFQNYSQLFATLIERYQAPIKAQDQSKKIQQLEEELTRFKTLNEELSNSVDGTSGTLKKYQESNEAITAERNKLLEENLQLRESIETSKLPPDTHAIKIDPLNMEILKYVANREGKARNQEWTPEDVINYFVHHRFERGDVNGGFKSVPDSKIREMKQALIGEGEE
ncbi:MAG: hypothetical protein GX793_01595 [Bacteroidales bacterium]|jgi:chromosome segregation ATPase|nr:hypothetical protein [Bacteroidales bacterium]